MMPQTITVSLVDPQEAVGATHHRTTSTNADRVGGYAQQHRQQQSTTNMASHSGSHSISYQSTFQSAQSNNPPSTYVQYSVSSHSNSVTASAPPSRPRSGGSRPSTPSSIHSGHSSGYNSVQRQRKSATPARKTSNQIPVLQIPSSVNVSTHSTHSGHSFSSSTYMRRPQSAPIRKRSRTPNRSPSTSSRRSEAGSASPSFHTFNGEIRVMSRFRPLIYPQVDSDPLEVNISYEKQEEGTTIFLNDKRIELHKDMICLPARISQEDLYNQHIKRQVNQFVLKGNTGCVLLYGKTGSGKTYTAGVGENEIAKGLRDESRKGIIPRALQDIFSQLEQSDTDESTSQSELNSDKKDNQQENDSDFMIHLSLIEIYGKDVYDMLSDMKEKKKRKLECQAFGSLFYPCYPDEKHDPVNSRSRYLVKSYKEAIRLVQKGIKRREVSEHTENKDSSRSHCLMFIHLTKNNTQVMTPHTTSTFVVADLCGMEYIKKTSSNAREASAINASLTFLRDILVIMSQKSSSISFEIKFRYHPLCKLLKCCMVSAYYPTTISLIVCCTTTLRDFSETVSSLKFANMASQIKISAIQAKTTASQAMFDKRALEAEMSLLRSQLNQKMEKIRRLQQELSRAKTQSMAEESSGEVGESELKRELKKLSDLRVQILDLQNLKQQLDFEIEEYRKLQEENRKMQTERKQLIQQQKLSDLKSQNMKGVIDAFCASMQEIVTLTSNNADNVVEQLLGDLQTCFQPAGPESNTLTLLDGKEELERAIQTIHQLPENLRVFKSKYQEILKSSLKNALQTQKDKFKEILERVHHRHEEIVKKMNNDLEKEREIRLGLQAEKEKNESESNREATLRKRVTDLEALLEGEQRKNQTLQLSLKRANLTIRKKDELLSHYQSLENEIDNRFSISDSP